jgi:hypothetical protein
MKQYVALPRKPCIYLTVLQGGHETQKKHKKLKLFILAPVGSIFTFNTSTQALQKGNYMLILIH